MLGLDKRESFVDSAVGSDVLPTGLQVFTLQRLFTQRVPSERPAALVIKHDTRLSSAKDIVMVRYKIIIANIPILQNDLQFVQAVISIEVVQYRTQTVFIPRKIIIPWPS